MDKENTQVYLTSDTHFNHGNVIKYQNRPFDSVSHMNQEIIRRWNETVREKDHVYHLGDFGYGSSDSLRNILSELNGKVYFVIGNHDEQTKSFKDKFQFYGHYLEVNMKGYDQSIKETFVLSHYPFERWNKRHWGYIHLHGHEHSGYKLTAKNRVEVGMDSWDYRPVHFQDILDLCKNGTPVKNPFWDGHH